MSLNYVISADYQSVLGVHCHHPHPHPDPEPPLEGSDVKLALPSV